MTTNKLKKNFKIALPASIGSFFVILLISFISLDSPYGVILTVSFGATMVLLFGYPSNLFAQPKNIFFGHLITAIVGLICTYINLPLFLAIATAVSLGIFFMIVLNLVHPPAGGNPIAILLGGHNHDFIFITVIIGSIVILILGIIINRYVFGVDYPA